MICSTGSRAGQEDQMQARSLTGRLPPQRTSSARAAVVVLAALALVLPACGGGSDGSAGNDRPMSAEERQQLEATALERAMALSQAAHAARTGQAAPQ